MKNTELIEKLYENQNLEDCELLQLINTISEEEREKLFYYARRVREREYGNDVYIRGLIEFTNVCKNDCYYCGIRKSNDKVERYRLTLDEILECAREGYVLGFRTFVLQGGEDSYFTKEKIGKIVKCIKNEFPDCAITLSVGERTYDEYEYWWNMGADRYLLRHETANEVHYKKLHPYNMSLENRKECLYSLRKIGYQVGAGFMVDSPYQTTDNLVEDLRFMQDLRPHMIGIGPYLSHKNTPFNNQKNGSLQQTLVLLAIIRLLFPKVLLPATTALGTIDPNGRELGLKAGANVVMPNLSPVRVRKKYELYDNKICTGEESAQCRNCLNLRVESTGYHIVTDIGNSRIQ
ncbi:[FeFe] hydrogenase H-cluster radical SAM maturase HydE [uncultured Eubacterium sp.]|uniref:[FeFe] hydrogenase H-cluster radical SAM maturase HydE n=1 Tax=uncultured Eubacterium sp. TaxID=165185 RepID=UPI002616D4A5|nr:[FeFe] hydrogenase H-cluster radical SAM maturase HydE [uncultured Eubacterium sp.]